MKIGNPFLKDNKVFSVWSKSYSHRFNFYQFCYKTLLICSIVFFRFGYNLFDLVFNRFIMNFFIPRQCCNEENIRELQPVTRVPVAPYGIIVDVANIRMNNIPVFTGCSDDKIDVIGWISRILNLAESRRLTFDATINLMIQGSGKGAANYIDEMKQEGKTLHQVIQQLEMRYGSLTTVEDARIKCNNMVRGSDEHLSDFIDRLRIMSKMACRNEPDDGLRRRAVDILVEGNIRRVLPSSVRLALEERIMNRSLMGLPALSARDVEKEALDLEQKRSERKQELKRLRLFSPWF